MVQIITLLGSAAAVFSSIAAAAEPTSSFNSSVVQQVLSNIDTNTANAYCNAQYRACTVLCNNAPTNNNCTAATLEYSCTCSNGSAPAFQYYNPTMTSQICQNYLGECLSSAATQPNPQTLQLNCQNEIICGNSSVDAYASSPAGMASPSSASASSSSSSASASPTGSSTAGTASPSPSSGAAAALEIAQGYATPLFGAMLLGAFGLAL